MKETCTNGRAELSYEQLAQYHNGEEPVAFIHEHLATLYFIVREFDATSVLEIGTGNGASTLTFAEAGAKVLSVDIEDCEDAKNLIKSSMLTGQVDFMKGRSENLEFDKDQSFDIVFLDGDHTYQQVTLELNKFAHLANKFIILHDITNPSHKGVDQAVIEFRRKNTDWTYYQWFNNNGLAVLARRV